MVQKLKSLLLCFLSAALLGLPYYNGRLWIFAWFGFVPLFFVLKDKSKFHAFLLSYFTGIIFWLWTIYWLIHVTLFGMILLVLYLALYFGIFGIFISPPNSKLLTPNLIFIPSIWVLLEYLRSYLLTGFGWAILGYGQYLNLPVIQIADITGAYGVSFLIMMANVAIYSVYDLRCTVYGQKKKYLLPLICIIAVLAYGYYKLYRTPYPVPRKPIKVSIIQGNIEQELKWNPQSRDFILTQYLDLSAKAAMDKPDLIIWPEAALPEIVEEKSLYYEKVKNFVSTINIPLLTGAVTDRGNFFYNSALLINPRGELASSYDKLHLVPFGEYIPLKRILGFLETIVPIGEITPGRDYTVFNMSLIKEKVMPKFSVLICFEDIFPDISRQFIKGGADFLVNITNDAWYKKTSAAYQHLAASVFRAIENRVFLVRAANTGVSGFIGREGKILSLVKDKDEKNIFIAGYATKDIDISKHKITFYCRYPYAFIFFCIFGVIYGIICGFKKSKL